MGELNTQVPRVPLQRESVTNQTQIDLNSSTDAALRQLKIPEKLDTFITSLVHRDRNLLNNKWQISSILESYNIREKGLSYGQLFDTLKSINLDITEAYADQFLLPALKEAFPKGNHAANIASFTSPIATLDPYKEYLIAPAKGLPEHHYVVQSQPRVLMPPELKDIVSLEKNSDGFISQIKILGKGLPIKSDFALTEIKTTRASDGLIATFKFNNRPDGKPLKPVHFYIEAKEDPRNPQFIHVEAWRVAENGAALVGANSQISQHWKKIFDADSFQK